jgi:hypothetical protein
MWGLVHPGIRQFKAGFGGREITTIGAWELPLDRLGAALYRAGESIVGRTARGGGLADEPAGGEMPAEPEAASERRAVRDAER